MQLATFDTERIQDTLVVQVRGEIDRSNADEVSATVRQASDGGRAATPGHVRVVLTEVSFLDSAGLNALVELYQELHAAGRSLNVIMPPARSPARRVFNIIQAERILPVTEPETPTPDR